MSTYSNRSDSAYTCNSSNTGTTATMPRLDRSEEEVPAEDRLAEDGADEENDNAQYYEGWGELIPPVRIYDGDLDDQVVFWYVRDTCRRHHTFEEYIEGGCMGNEQWQKELDETREGNEGIVEWFTLFVDQVYDAILQTDVVEDEKNSRGQDAQAVHWMKQNHWTHDQIRLAAWRIVLDCYDVQPRTRVGVEVKKIRTGQKEMTIEKVEYDHWLERLKATCKELYSRKSICKNWLDIEYKNQQLQLYSKPKGVSETKEANGKSNKRRADMLNEIKHQNDVSDDDDADDDEQHGQPARKVNKQRKTQTASKRQRAKSIGDGSGSRVKRQPVLKLQDRASTQEPPQSDREHSISDLSSYRSEFDPSQFPRVHIPASDSGDEYAIPHNRGQVLQGYMSSNNRDPSTSQNVAGNGMRAGGHIPPSLPMGWQDAVPAYPTHFAVPRHQNVSVNNYQTPSPTVPHSRVPSSRSAVSSTQRRQNVGGSYTYHDHSVGSGIFVPGNLYQSAVGPNANHSSDGSTGNSRHSDRSTPPSMNGGQVQAPTQSVMNNSRMEVQVPNEQQVRGFGALQPEGQVWINQRSRGSRSVGETRSGLRPQSREPETPLDPYAHQSNVDASAARLSLTQTREPEFPVYQYGRQPNIGLSSRAPGRLEQQISHSSSQPSTTADTGNVSVGISRAPTAIQPPAEEISQGWAGPGFEEQHVQFVNPADLEADLEIGGRGEGVSGEEFIDWDQ